MTYHHSEYVGLLKPLTVALSSCLLFACASQPSHTTKAPVIVAPPASVGTTVIQPSQPAVATPSLPATIEINQFAGVLDQQTLDELEDLLMATDMTMVEGDALLVQQHGNLWDRVRGGYRMEHIKNPRIEAQKSWFYQRQDYINRLTARASRYLHHTVVEAERRGIPTELALLPIIESSYDPSATSNAAAAGLWQFIPSTGRIYGLNQSASYDGRRDVIESTRAAYDFLTSLYNQFGSWELALAAYNAGPGRVQKAIASNRTSGLPTDYWSLRLPKETMDYVPRFMAVAQIVLSPNSYGIQLPAIANQTHFRTVPTNYGVSLQEISSVSGVSVDELKLLNPALIGSSVDTAGPGRVVIPNDVPFSIDDKIKALAGIGHGASTYVASAYVLPNMGQQQNQQSAQELSQSRTLPTTSATLTASNTIRQEPPLSSEELDFIAHQIKTHSADQNVKAIAKDGNIELIAVQTGQSVLEARGETKSLSFNAPIAVQSSSQASTQASSSNKQSSNQQSTQSKSTQGKTDGRYKVVAGDTLTSIAAAHHLSVAQLAQYNDVSTTYKVKTGDRLWLVPGENSTVSDKPKATTVKTTTHVVQPGESLTSISRKYKTSIQDLASLNGLSVNDGILINQKLTVPEVKGIKPNTTVSSTKTATPVKYTVQSGDSLTSVANKYSISVGELAAANNMSDDAHLIRGKTITIPVAGTTPINKSATAKKTTKEQSATTKAKGKILKSTETYTVKSGESLNSLANKYGVSVADLAATNNLSVTDKLKIGQTIKVPKLTETYVVKSGDSLNSVAKKYGISVNDLAKMNNLDKNAGLKKGQKLTVPTK